MRVLVGEKSDVLRIGKEIESFYFCFTPGRRVFSYSDNRSRLEEWKGERDAGCALQRMSGKNC